MTLRSVCVFCGAQPGSDPRYVDLARRTGEVLAERDLTLVYGGGQVGMMGAVADAALEGGSEVIGVIPEALLDREVAHPGVTRLEVVDTMLQRKTRMVELSDAFVTLPGGLGTMDELFEVWTWSYLGYHDKPMGLLSVNGYFESLAVFLDHAMDEGFVRRAHHERMLVGSDPVELLNRLAEEKAVAQR